MLITDSAREADALAHHHVVIHETAQQAAGLLPFAENFITGKTKNCNLSVIFDLHDSKSI
jgi:hypothetical protein